MCGGSHRRSRENHEARLFGVLRGFQAESVQTSSRLACGLASAGPPVPRRPPCHTVAKTRTNVDRLNAESSTVVRIGGSLRTARRGDGDPPDFRPGVGQSASSATTFGWGQRSARSVKDIRSIDSCSREGPCA
jgi:hypothetical protein